MMGLLGEGWDDPKSTAILQMASGLMSTRNPGMALSRGIQGYQQAMNDAEERKWTKQEREYLLSERKRKEQEALDAQMRSSKIRGLLSDAFSPVSPSQAIGLDGAGPTADKATLIGQQKPVNYQQLAAQIVSMGGDPAALKTIAESANYGRNKVARTVKGMGPDGREYEYQVDDFGQKVGDGLAQYRAPIMQDLGGQVAALDPYKLTPVTQFQKSMSPDAQASNAVAWANNALARNRLAFDMAGGAEAVNGAKPQFKDGNWVMPPRAMQPGTSVPAMPSAGVKDANEALALIDQARKIIPDATGSYIGTGIDQGMRAFGVSTKGDIATGQLQALEGALVAKMPKMSGPQSDKDVALYKQMAGVIGDPTIPVDRKLAALQTVEEIQRRYAGAVKQMPAAGSLGSGQFRILSVE